VYNSPAFVIDIAPFTSAKEMAGYRLVHVEGAEGVGFCRVYELREKRGNYIGSRDLLPASVWPRTRTSG
jgi:hypothetical protein